MYQPRGLCAQLLGASRPPPCGQLGPALWGELECSAQLGIRRHREERPSQQDMPDRNLR
jgi:hypothetical protein